MGASVAEFFVAPSQFGDRHRRAIGARGTIVHFSDGSQALCGTSGLWNTNLGYGNRAVAQAIAQASREASYLSLFRYGHAYAERGADALLEFALPHRYARVLFATAGGAALDAAIKIARQYWVITEKPRRRLVVSLRGSYHGMTFGAFGLTGETLDQQAYGVDQRMVRHVDHADPEQISALIRASGAAIASITLEPLLGSGAHVVHPAVIDAVFRGRQEHGYLVVADEVATGFGRTGPAFASHRWPAQPDLLVTSKGLTNGTCAASAVLWSERVAEAFDRSDAMLVHGETQAGSPQSCAAIEATVAQFGQLDALERGRAVATTLDSWLSEATASISSIKSVRGQGCFRAVVLHDADGLELDGAAIAQLVERCRRNGAIVHPGPSCLQLVPALTYSHRGLCELLNRVGAVLRAGAPA